MLFAFRPYPITNRGSFILGVYPFESYKGKSFSDYIDLGQLKDSEFTF